MLIDSHAHLSSFEDEVIQPILDRSRQAGVDAVINICTNREELKKGLQFPDWIFNAASTTPHDAATLGNQDFEFFAEHARSKKLIAIGETGLDYYYYKETAELQQQFLRRYLALAAECKLPIIIHCRDAFADLFKILDEEAFVPGVLHCFTGTLDEAKQVIERGWYLSLSGIVTFKKSEGLREVAKVVPLEQLLIETDAPYLTPHPHRSQRNEPSYLPLIAKCIAESKGIPFEDLAIATSQNTKKLFNL